MFGWSKSKREKLEIKYKDLMAESHRLSTIDRKRSDQKMAEAEEVRKAIDQLEAN